MAEASVAEASIAEASMAEASIADSAKPRPLWPPRLTDA